MPIRRTIIEIDAALADVETRIDALYWKNPVNIADLVLDHGYSQAEALKAATEAARARPPFDDAEYERLRKLRDKLQRERTKAREPWDK